MPRSEPLPARTVRPPLYSHLLTALAFAASVASARGHTLLTSRGNAETVALSWQDGRATVLTDDTPQTAGSCVPCTDRGVGRLHEVCADMDISEASVEVLVMLPLPLVETWMMLPTRDGEFLDPSEQRACGEALPALMRGALSVESDGRSVVPELVEFRFVPPCAGINRRGVVNERVIR